MKSQIKKFPERTYDTFKDAALELQRLGFKRGSDMGLKEPVVRFDHINEKHFSPSDRTYAFIYKKQNSVAYSIEFVADKNWKPKVIKTKNKNRFPTFEEAKSALIYLGFKQDTPFVETAEWGGIVRFMSDRYFAFVHKEKANNAKQQRFQIYYFEKDDMEISIGPKAKPGPKPSGDTKERVVIYVKQSVVGKLGGIDATRDYLYKKIDEFGTTGFYNPKNTEATSA